MHNGAGEKYHAGDLFDGARWQRNVTLEVDADGSLSAVRPNTPRPDGAEILRGPVLPGMPNLHSHAFQRAMAGLTEIRRKSDDSFWSWRDSMYRLAAALGPDELEAVAAQAFVEMLKAGYTSVCEFHYLHRDIAGACYEDPATLGKRLLQAARVSGIGITLLPVLYQQGGFGGQPLEERQRRFGLSIDRYLEMIEAVATATAPSPDQSWGLALHSLRAVAPEALAAVLAAVEQRCPVHIHIAEQRREVSDCLAFHGARPVAWLAGHVDLDRRWTLIHATHMEEGEVAAVADSGAIVGLCPTTEANLGDGFFSLKEYVEAGGTFGIGSDSQISIAPSEELRWLEYGNRLRRRRRNTLARASEPRSGTLLWRRALAGGAAASARPIGRLAAGARADWLVLDAESALMIGADVAASLDILVFSGNQPAIRDVMVGGRWRVRDGHHRDEESTCARFLKVARRLDV